MQKHCFTWDEATFTWDNNPYTWDDVCLAIALGAGDFDSWPEKEKKRVIALYVKVKLQTEPELFYTMRPETLVEQIELKEVKITAADIQLIVDTVLNVRVEI